MFVRIKAYEVYDQIAFSIIKQILNLVLSGLSSVFESSLLLFERGQTDTLFSWEGDPRVLSLSNHENVADSGGERVSSGISDVNDIETSDVSVSVDYNSDSSDVVTGSDHAQVTYALLVLYTR